MTDSGPQRLASEAEWLERTQGPTVFRYYGGGIGRTHRSWRLLNTGGAGDGVLVRFSGSFFDGGGFVPIQAAMAVGPHNEVLLDEEGRYRAKTLVYVAERRDLEPVLVDGAWQVAWSDLRIPAGYIAATDQSIKRRISVADIDRAMEKFDELLLDLALYGDWEGAEAGDLHLEVLVGEDLHVGYSSTEHVFSP